MRRSRPKLLRPVNDLVAEGATGASSFDDFVRYLSAPRAVWVMVPAAGVDEPAGRASPDCAGDIVIDGGNSYYIDDIRRARGPEALGIHYLDVGASGGVWGLERGYCMMIGGPARAVQYLGPDLPHAGAGRDNSERTPGREKCRSARRRTGTYTVALWAPDTS